MRQTLMPKAAGTEALRTRRTGVRYCGGGPIRQRGFTLVEVLVASAVMIVAAAVAVPSAAHLVSQYQFAGATSQVAMEVTRARMQAIAQSRTVRVGLDTSGQGICRQTATSADGPWTPESCNGADNVIGLAGGTVVSGTFPTFGRTGIAQAASQIYLINGDLSRTLGVSILGRVTVE